MMEHKARWGTYRLIPVFLGFRVESIQSFKPYLVHLSQGLLSVLHELGLYAR
jgi:hypothetical protein